MTNNKQAIDTKLVNNITAAAEVAEMAGFTGKQVWEHVKDIVMEMAGVSETEATAAIQEAKRQMAAEGPGSEPKTFAVTVELVVAAEDAKRAKDIVDNVLFNYDIRYGLVMDWVHVKTTELTMTPETTSSWRWPCLGELPLSNYGLEEEDRG